MPAEKERDLFKELEAVSENEGASVQSRKRSLKLIIEFSQLDIKFKLKRSEVIRFLDMIYNL